MMYTYSKRRNGQPYKNITRESVSFIFDKYTKKVDNKNHKHMNSICAWGSKVSSIGE